MYYIRDTADTVSKYEPISIIEFQGSVRTTGESAGHYVCDVKDRSTGMWFRTNDNDDPQPIDLEGVSRCAYVVLYRKINDWYSPKIHYFCCKFNAVILLK